GQPKGVLIEQSALIDHVFGLIHSAGLHHCHSYALFAALTADAGHAIVFAALFTGATLHVLSDDLLGDAPQLHHYLQQYPVDCITIVPSLWLSYAPETPLPLPRQVLLFGGESLPRSALLFLARHAFDGRVFNHYGPTETTIGKLIFPVDLRHPYDRVPIGRPF